MKKLKKGFVQVYTGNGKGKTTAAIGQAIRAAGFGMKVLIIQFMKNFPYNELNALKRFDDLIEIKQFGDDEFVFKKMTPSEKDKNEIIAGINFAAESLQSGNYDLIILDELCVTFFFKLIEVKDVMHLFELKKENVELVITGRYCPDEILQKADLITEMKEVKHYYAQGILSRKGIDC